MTRSTGTPLAEMKYGRLCDVGAEEAQRIGQQLLSIACTWQDGSSGIHSLLHNTLIDWNLLKYCTTATVFPSSRDWQTNASFQEDAL